MSLNPNKNKKKYKISSSVRSVSDHWLREESCTFTVLVLLAERGFGL